MADDYMFLLECLNKGKRMYVMSECLVSYQWLRSHKTTRQLNQSSDIFRVLQAYVMVYYALQQKTDLHPSVLAFIHSYDYRKRFLYELIVRRTQVAENRIELLKLHPAHQQELSRYMAKPWRYVVLLKIYFTVVYEFAQQFGLKGIIYSIQTGIAYLRYKVLRI